MHLKFILLAAVLGVSLFGLGFYVANNSVVDGTLSRYGAVLSKTFGDVFGIESEKMPVIEISLDGEKEKGLGISSQPASSGNGKIKSEIFLRSLSVRQNSRQNGEVRSGGAAPPTPTSMTKTPPTPATALESISPQPQLLPGKININTASYDELQKITGVGSVIAQKIIDYRNQSGLFRVIEDIKNVSGIGEAKFEKMKEEITVGDVAPLVIFSGGASATTTPTATTITTTPTLLYAVSVSMQGDGSGKVTSNPAGINCGFDCAEDFAAGAKVVLTAAPESNSSFGGWGGACSGSVDCALDVNGRLAVAATFNLIAGAASPPAADAPVSALGKILISEIFYDALGSDTGKEFVELYNTGSSDTDLSGWSLKRDGNSLALIGSKSEDKKIIKANGFFLVGLNGYTGTPVADVVRSASLPNTSATIELYDPSGNLIDSVNYNNSVSEGQSYERKPLTENGQFAIQPNPNPQNSGL